MCNRQSCRRDQRSRVDLHPIFYSRHNSVRWELFTSLARPRRPSGVTLGPCQPGLGLCNQRGGKALQECGGFSFVVKDRERRRTLSPSRRFLISDLVGSVHRDSYAALRRICLVITQEEDNGAAPKVCPWARRHRPLAAARL